jgi:hypothetical protein
MSVWGLLYMLHCTSFQLGRTDSKRPIDDKFAGNELREVKTLDGLLMQSRKGNGQRRDGKIGNGIHPIKHIDLVSIAVPPREAGSRCMIP